jgi:glycosyltransferase involved in cell wall biosynthesis
MVGRAAARLAGTPGIIHTVHGFAFHDRSRLAEKVLGQVLERIAGHWCDVVVTVSEYHASVARQIGIAPDKVRAIPNGLSVRPMSANPKRVREQLALGPETTMLLAVGRLARQKGLEHLIRATALLNEGAHPKCCTVIVGEGELLTKLEQLACELRIADMIRFAGFRTDVADLLSAADIVVLPSLWEGLSISLLEAMAAGKPIVTTSIPSNLEVTADGHSAYLVPPGDAAALADAVRILARDPAAREHLGTAAQARFFAHYTEHRMVASYLQCYESLLACGPEKSGRELRRRTQAKDYRTSEPT